MEQTIKHLHGIIFVFLITSCASTPSLRDISLQYDLLWAPVETSGFTLHAIAKPLAKPVDDLHIYIGGDGTPWQDNKPTANPTGRRNLTIDLLLADSTPAIYLTRPCYQLIHMPPECHSELWTSARYSEPVVLAMADAITQLVDKWNPDSFTLIGYSGGGVLALLAAAQIEPQPRVITVASNLDTKAWTEFHGHLPLSESSNPLLAIHKSGGAGHTHLIGGKDKVVPPSTVESYRSAHPLATYRYFEDFDHQCCWAAHWREILRESTL
ncbi:MAG: hypothetical protein ABJ056_09080 [Halioglobus sp.]